MVRIVHCLKFKKAAYVYIIHTITFVLSADLTQISHDDTENLNVSFLKGLVVCVQGYFKDAYAEEIRHYVSMAGGIHVGIDSSEDIDYLIVPFDMLVPFRRTSCSKVHHIVNEFWFVSVLFFKNNCQF